MKFFAVALVVLSSGAFAQTLDPFLGLVARWPIVYNDSALQGGGAQAKFFQGRRVVIISPKWVSTVTNNIAGAVLQHEYCHHDLNHTTATILDEANADCCAAGALAQGGHWEAIEEFSNHLAAEGCSYDPMTPIQNVNRSHPCGTQRSWIIQRCAEIVRNGN